MHAAYAVDKTMGGTPMSADCVQVHDHNLEHIGWGFFNPASMYRVRYAVTLKAHKAAMRPGYSEQAHMCRLMQRVQDMQQPHSLADLPQRALHASINDAVQLRRTLGLPSSQTNAYRLINRYLAP